MPADQGSEDKLKPLKITCLSSVCANRSYCFRQTRCETIILPHVLQHGELLLLYSRGRTNDNVFCLRNGGLPHES